MAEVLVTTEVFPEALARLREAGHRVRAPAEGRLSRAELLDQIATADALVCLLSDRVDEGLFSAAPRLKVVANLGVGVDNIDLSAATRHGVVVTNTPDVLTETTADLAWALLMAAARRIVEADSDLRAHGFPGWTFIPPHMGVDVWGRTLGVVGLGRIGSAVARRAKGFEMRVLYHSRTRKPALEAALSARWLPLDDLLSESDFVVLCVPLTPETRHLIGPRELSLMKEEAILVNIARGPVVDEAALALALKEGRLRAAALDVFEREPEVHPELLSLRNVVLTPHIGSATLFTRRKMAELAVESVISVLSGRRPENLVNPEAWR
ncbi:D-glycerate dehydrogenase [Candidatus Bipolaricaulota bacterium]|nr:D-glycerate dehydrogenase [Candidatus Bipolaricaulota bacterium]